MTMTESQTRSRSSNATAIFLSVALGLAGFNVWYGTLLIGPGGGGPRNVATGGGGGPTDRATSAEKRSSWPGDYPRRHNFNFTLGICAIVKDGEAYLTEWLDYHLDAMGIENVYIYDNSPDFDLRAWHANTRSHPLYRRAEVRHLPDFTVFRQGRAYMDCVMRHGRSPHEIGVEFSRKKGWEVTDRAIPAGDGMDFLAFIDVDEFFVPRGDYTSVHGVVADYLHPYEGGSLTVNWMLFGSANRTLYVPVPVTKRFQWRDGRPHGVVKSIVRASDFHSMNNPHAASTLHGHRRTTSSRGAVLRRNVSASGASDPARPDGVLLLHHYRYTSHKEYYHKKCVRRETDGDKGCSRRTGKVITEEELKEMGMPTHIAMRTGTVFDDSAWRLLTERVPKYRVFDDELAWGDYS